MLYSYLDLNSKLTQNHCSIRKNIVKQDANKMPEKKLADRLREAIRLRGYSIRTEEAYLYWL